MKKNEGTIDRALRITAGVALLGSALAGLLGPWAYIGFVPILTGSLGFCPLYSVLGISTCPLKNKANSDT